jgi:hypothetical protein
MARHDARQRGDLPARHPRAHSRHGCRDLLALLRVGLAQRRV